MSVFIITHPFYGNYGGMLQAYALQQTLKLNSIESYIYQYYEYPRIPFLKEIAKIIYNRTREVLATIIPKLGKKNISPILYCRNGQNFLYRYVKYVSSEGPQTSAKSWIVGSDQVWRAEHVKFWGELPFFFLGDQPKEMRAKSIAYAASFGLDKWAATEDEANRCSTLLRDFKAVSVREHSGIEICRQRMGVNAVQMPDPTLLLGEEQYSSLINKEKTWKPESGYIAAYVLDRTQEQDTILISCAQQTQMEVQHLTPSATAKKRRDRFPISVSQWLRLIRDCKYLVTDSFHGCVFAIIFNKPFVCLGNKNRGSARFDSLLKTFGLQNRLVANRDVDTILQTLNTPIDWLRVNSIREQERARGIEFLTKNLV